MLLYGLLNRGEAYLIPTWLMREQRLAQVKINQSQMQQSSDSAAGDACSTDPTSYEVLLSLMSLSDACHHPVQ